MKSMMTMTMMCVVCVLLSSTSSADADLPHVLAQSGHIYLTRSLSGRLDCPTDANPAVTHVVWTRDDRPVIVDAAASDGRVRVSRHGSLVFRPATAADSGLYTCTPYSRLGKGQPSAPIHLHVKGSAYIQPTFLNRLNVNKITTFAVNAGDSVLCNRSGLLVIHFRVFFAFCRPLVRVTSLQHY